MGAEDYLTGLVLLLEELREQRVEELRALGARIGRSVAAGGILHLFGSGHSHMAAREPFVRAGTLTTVRAIWPQQITDKLERVEGLGEAVLGMGDVRSGEVLFVISHSGINPLPIDVADAARAMGSYVVGVGSRRHSLAAEPRHSSGRRLMDATETFLDTGVPPGDALLKDLPGLPPVGPASTVMSVALIHSALVEAVVWLTENGHEPPIRVSRNWPGGDEVNDRLGERYGDRIPELR